MKAQKGVEYGLKPDGCQQAKGGKKNKFGQKNPQDFDFLGGLNKRKLT